MEKNSINVSPNNNGISLQLRSKEVSEVMGSIPTWVGVWGTVMIFLLFTGSMLLIFNIHCIQKVSSKVTMLERQISINPETVSQDYFLQVTVPMIEYNKIKAGQKITLSFHGENNYFNKLAGIKFLVDKKTINKDSCVLRLMGNRDAIKKMIPYNSTLTNGVASCELVLDMTVFEKVFGSLFW
jgi:hypothetical protein